MLLDAAEQQACAACCLLRMRCALPVIMQHAAVLGHWWQHGPAGVQQLHAAPLLPPLCSP
eukprot:364199-Chlamydomonas_euryale.AAC.10